MLSTFHTSVQLAQASDELSVEQLSIEPFRQWSVRRSW